MKNTCAAEWKSFCSEKIRRVSPLFNLLFLLLVLIIPVKVSAEVITWTGFGGGYWSDPTKWDLRRVPGPGDSVVINTTTCDMSGASISVDALTLNGGTLTGSGTLAVNFLTWNGGIMNGSGSTVVSGSGTFILGTGETKVLSQRTLVNSGVATHNAGKLQLEHGAVLNNNGTWYLAADGDLLGVFTPEGAVINNSGTLAKTGGAGTTSSYIPINNTGTIYIGGGTLNLIGGGTFQDAWDISGGGDIQFSIGAVNFQSARTPSLAGQALLTSGTTSFNAAVQFARLTLSGGTLSGTDTLTVNDLTWNGGIMNGSGSTVVPGNGTFTLGTTGTKVLSQRTLVNNGTASHNAGKLQFESGAVLNNSGTWNLTADGDLLGVFNPAGAIINNSGILAKTGGAGTTNSYTQINNTGTLSIAAGTLNLIGGGTFQGAWNISGAGDIQFSTASTNFQSAGTPSLTGQALLASGTTSFNAAAQFARLTLSGGTLSGTGTLTVNDLTWNGGSMSGSGNTVVPGNGTFTLGTTSTKVLTQRVLVNNGSASHNAGKLQFQSDAVLNNAGAWNLTADGDLFGVSNPGAAVINNSGTMAKTGGSGTTTINTPFNSNGGTVMVSTGILAISGNSAIGAAGISIGGTSLGSQYARIAVGSTATLSGTLAVTLANGYTPAVGDSFSILTYGGRSGAFGVLNLPVLAPGKEWDVAYTAVSLNLSVKAVTYALSVSLSGSGSGSVASLPAGISCGVICSSTYDSRTSITLTATPGSGSTFSGWSGACSGTGTCTLSMTEAKSVGAEFTAIVNGSCGASNGHSFVAAPTTSLCSAGSVSNITGTGPWSWSCNGINGGTSDFCSAVRVGDCDANGTITIAEVQSAINMFLGLKAVAACVDASGDNTVSISEVQKVINSFLGL